MRLAFVVLALASALLAAACVETRLDRALKTPDQIQTLDHRSAYLKVHMKDGQLYVLSKWQVDDAARRVSGEGERFGLSRETAGGGILVKCRAVARSPRCRRALPSPPGGSRVHRDHEERGARNARGTPGAVADGGATGSAIEACRGDEGDCFAKVRAFDNDERFNATDGEDLARREVIELQLPTADGPRGFVIAFRQTLASTYLFYQSLAWLGRSASATLAALERGDHTVGGALTNLRAAVGGKR